MPIARLAKIASHVKSISFSLFSKLGLDRYRRSEPVEFYRLLVLPERTSSTNAFDFSVACAANSAMVTDASSRESAACAFCQTG